MKDSTAPRIIYRDMTFGRVRYLTIRLDDVMFVPTHVERGSFTFDGAKFKPDPPRTRPDRVRVFTPGTLRDVPPAQVGDYVRRPSAKALARIEAAEAAIAAAQLELKAARLAAFTYGKPITVHSVKAWDKMTRMRAEREAASV